MKTIGFLKSLAKWSAIFLAVYVGSNLFFGLELETRFGLLIGGLGLAIAYVDGTQKDRISNLELRISRLERRESGDMRQYPFD